MTLRKVVLNMTNRMLICKQDLVWFSVLMNLDLTYFQSIFKENIAQSYLHELSPPPVMRLMVCQSTSRHHTTPPCPLKVPKRSPFRDHHTLGLESFAAENNRSPSRLYLICVMARSCPCSIRGFQDEKQKIIQNVLQHITKYMISQSKGKFIYNFPVYLLHYSPFLRLFTRKIRNYSLVFSLTCGGRQRF